ncbi:MAG: hypothetical protein KGI54_08730 [Pseudomonadota bacterium]|nr:hypothetical protein [Pseudomonadota bacterium]
MTKQTESMELALEALENHVVADSLLGGAKRAKAMAALCEALTAPKQKPVAWLTETEDGDVELFFHRVDAVRVAVGPIYPLYYGPEDENPSKG